MSKTVTAVQIALQLLPSFVSAITPLGEGGKSAQARIYLVPDEVKVIDFTAAALPLGPKAAMLVVTGYSVIVPPPFARVDTWNLLTKLTSVDVLPLLVIVEEKFCATFAAAVVGVIFDAVRSTNGTAETVTAALAGELSPPKLEQVRVYVYVPALLRTV